MKYNTEEENKISLAEIMKIIEERKKRKGGDDDDDA